jgi:hypothetical protein
MDVESFLLSLRAIGGSVGHFQSTLKESNMTNRDEYTEISISVDGVWAGSGKLRDGIIYDCGAVFAGDQDESENVYELIEDAINNGKDSLKVELSYLESAVQITWTITPPAAS